jgi:hypothetical protein
VCEADPGSRGTCNGGIRGWSTDDEILEGTGGAGDVTARELVNALRHHQIRDGVVQRLDLVDLRLHGEILAGVRLRELGIVREVDAVQAIFSEQREAIDDVSRRDVLGELACIHAVLAGDERKQIAETEADLVEVEARNLRVTLVEAALEPVAENGSERLPGADFVENALRAPNAAGREVHGELRRVLVPRADVRAS